MHPIDALGRPLAVITLVGAVLFWVLVVVVPGVREAATKRRKQGGGIVRGPRPPSYFQPRHTDETPRVRILPREPVFHDWDQDHWA